MPDVCPARRICLPSASVRSMGELAKSGRDKVTFVPSASLESFGLWAEQLVADLAGDPHPLDHADDEFLPELLVLVALGAACFHGFAYQQEHAHRVDGSKIHKGIDNGMRGVRMPHRGKLFQERLREMVKLSVNRQGIGLVRA